MPTFTAREKSELKPEGVKAPLYTPTTDPKPGDEVPSADPDGLRYLGDAMLFVYHTDDAESDVMKPGYFNNIMEKNSNSFHGALIIFTATGGEKDPAKWCTGILRAIQVSGGRGVSSDAPTLVATVARFGEATTNAVN